MIGDDRKRFCQHCQQHVYNLSSLSEVEIVRLMEGSGDRICGRLYRRADGTIVSNDCQRATGPPVRTTRVQFTIAHVLALITISATAFASLPWLGNKIEPIVRRWFAAPSLPAPPTGFVPGEEIGMIELRGGDINDVD
jgi:hypothetical protein